MPVASRSIEALLGVTNAEIAVRDLKRRNRYEVKLYKENFAGTVQYDPTKTKAPSGAGRGVGGGKNGGKNNKTKVVARTAARTVVENLTVRRRKVVATRAVAMPIRPKTTNGRLTGMPQEPSAVAIGNILRNK